MKIEVDAARLLSEIEELALLSEADPPAVTRVVFTPADMKARLWIGNLFREAGLEVRVDPIGNTFARWPGTDADAAAIGTGSHIDAIPNAGKFDGVVGVLGGLEAIRSLKRSGIRPLHPIELLLFTSEEPTRFGIGCLGSRLLSGSLSAEAVRKLTDKNGESVEDVRRRAGMSGDLERVRLPAGYYKAFVELHIEQGPILEHEDIPLGVVTRIAAPASARITIEGSGGHAGAVLMPDRRDALCAASELILAIEKGARESNSSDTVATVGVCDVFPGAVNSIPSRVHLSLDLRDTVLKERDRVMETVGLAAREISERRNVSTNIELLNSDPPAQSAPDVMAALTAACRKHGYPLLEMISRAYHDSLFMSRIAPVGMLFVPCRNGYSHRPDEFATIDDIARGTLVLAETLAQLAGYRV
jgi:N-carbamoyl-L-amino-acid hydrolase